MTFDFLADPFFHLDNWVQGAAGAGIKDPNAMALATIGVDQKPSVRIVLYKGLIRGGLSFYTNYEGRKGKELAIHPHASVCFFWGSLEKQLRVEGVVTRLTREESENYFRTRSRLSQIGAWASHQSAEIENHKILEDRTAELEKKFAGQEIPCPPFWGGFHLIPSEFEFWIGRQGRLHERYVYQREGSADWRRFMRAP